MRNLASALRWQIKFQQSAFDIPSEICKKKKKRNSLRNGESSEYEEYRAILGSTVYFLAMLQK